MLKTYLEFAGTRSFGPPYAASARLHGFLLHGSHERIQALVDGTLNQVANKYRFYPISNAVVLTFQSMEIRLPAGPPGSMLVHEMGVWLPVIYTAGGLPGFGMFIPYMYMDNDFGMISGRDVLGFPKSLAVFEHWPSFEAPDYYALQTYAFKKQTPDATLELMPFLQVVETENAGAPRGPARRPEDVVGELGQTLLGLDLKTPGIQRSPDFPLARGVSFPDLAEKFLVGILGEMTVLLLKQHRDAVAPARACFRQVVAAPGIFRDIKDFGWLSSEFQIEIAKLASEPLAGLFEKPRQHCRRAFRAHLDFEIQAGRYLT